MTQQSETLKTIRNGLNKPLDSSNSTLKPSEIYLFKSISRQDERFVRIFVERIKDVRHIYKNQSKKFTLLLSRYLDNEIVHT